MSSPEKGRIAHLGNGVEASKTEGKIVVEFKRIYEDAGKPKGMALFSHAVIGSSALSMTPASVPYCASSPTFTPWQEFDNPHGYGGSRWLAGDESLKKLADS
jgi:hypothetical protein